MATRARDLLREAGWLGQVELYGDPSGRAAKTTGPSDHAVLRECFPGAAWCIPGHPPHVRDRIAAVNGRLETLTGARHAQIDPSCVGLIADLEQVTFDETGQIGELLSSRILARRLGATWFDTRTVIRTAGTDPEKDPALVPEVAALARERLAPLLAPGRTVVTQGFIGSEASGRMTLLGRGGSDYSASLFGAALGASRIEIWTDVDGVLTANPRIVPSARRVRLMSFDEASELAYFGAKVLHPATLLPAIETSIPVKVLNARRPEGDGTTIVSRGVAPPDDRFVVKAIADKRRIVLVNVVSTRMLMAHGFLARIFRVFDEHRTPVDLLATSEVSVSLTIDDDRRLDAIVEALSEFAKVEVERGLAVVCLVGEGRYLPAIL